MTDAPKSNAVANFFRTLFFSVLGFFAVIGLLTSVIFGSLIYLAASQVSYSSAVSAVSDSVDLEKTMLKLEIDGPIVEGTIDPRDRFFGDLFGEAIPTSLDGLLTVLRRAKDDSRVEALYLDIKSPEMSLTGLMALRRSLDVFKKSEKPIYASMTDGNNASYLLATAADQINLNYIGGMMIPGPVFNLTYYAEALDKLGLEFEVFRAGRYKSAMEPMILNGPSEASLEMYRDLESSIRSEMLAMIAKGRNQSTEVVSGWLKQSIFTSDAALSAGLVDQVGYPEPWIDGIKESKSYLNIVKWGAYLKETADLDEAMMAEQGDSPAELAIIEASGQIVMDAPPSATDVITPGKLVPRLKWALEREEIKAVVFRINSPGGSALASDIIWENVRKLAEAKPVVVSMGAVAASGGYYIAAPATLIMADSATITGSIGVIGAAVNGRDMSEKFGLHFHVITTSDRKNYFDFGSQVTEQDREVVGASIDEVYKRFVNIVATGRKKDFEGIDRIAQGRVYTGARALQLGLVDRLGGKNEALRAAKELAGLNPDKLYPLAKYKGKPNSIFDCVGEFEEMMKCYQELESRVKISYLESQFGPQAKLLRNISNLKRMTDQGEILAFWPGSLHLQDQL